MRTTTVGSYPKVAEDAYGTKLIGALTRWQRKEIGDTDLEQTCRDITRVVIKEQEEAGIDVVTDGQIRWEDMVTAVARRVQGFEINGLSRWFDNNVYYRRPILHSEPKRKGPILAEAYRFAASCTKRSVKAVLPGPYTFMAMSEDRHYKSERKLAMALAEILNAEARDLAAAGAPVIQFDEPALGFGKPNLSLALEAIKVAVKGVSAQTAVYTYFGTVDGAVSAMMKAPVDIVGVDVVSDPKALSKLSKMKITKALALGCLDARNTKLETVAQLHKIFSAVKKLAPLDRVYVNPNAGLEFLPHAQARAKVRRLGEAVRTYQQQGRNT
jgi:5-methyltetrahydropteroyltriglutamate--homocysteine methyltransferase